MDTTPITRPVRRRLASTASLDWPLFGRDRDATFFAPQTQINAHSVSRLGVAWQTKLGPYQYLNESFPVEVGKDAVHHDLER